MKRILFAAATLLALFLGAHASDDRLPTKFVGDWCLAEHTADHLTFYRRGRCANPDQDEWLTIRPDSFDVHAGSLSLNSRPTPSTCEARQRSLQTLGYLGSPRPASYLASHQELR
jgi:hypothetical protein